MKFAWVFGGILVLLLLAGCTTGGEAGKKGKEIGEAGNITKDVQKQVPNYQGQGTETQKPRKKTYPKPYDPWKGWALYEDRENGISFRIPPGIRVETSKCRNKGGKAGCKAVAYWNGTGEIFLEYGSLAADTQHTLERNLELSGVLKRKQGEQWYTSKFGKTTAIEHEIEGEGFDREIYFGIAGNILSVNVRASGENVELAEKTWDSIRVSSNKKDRHQLMEFECGIDSDCFEGEICFYRTDCGSSKNKDGSYSSICISSGMPICKKKCEKDEDCPKTQRCFEYEKKIGGKVVKRDLLCS